MTELVVEFSPSAYLTDANLSRVKWIPVPCCGPSRTPFCRIPSHVWPKSLTD